MGGRCDTALHGILVRSCHAFMVGYFIFYAGHHVIVSHMYDQPTTLTLSQLDDENIIYALIAFKLAYY